MISEKRPGLFPREIALYALLGALCYSLKMAMSWLPNIEPVSFLVILYALVLGRRALYPIYVYVALEILTFGIHYWSVCYLYIWVILYGLTRCLRSRRDPLSWAILCGAYGLCFGLLCTPVYWLSGGWQFALSWWLSGIPYDLLHGAGNFFITLLLFPPCYRWLQRLFKAYFESFPHL